MCYCVRYQGLLLPEEWHKATGRVEHYHSEGIYVVTKPDIEHSSVHYLVYIYYWLILKCNICFITLAYKVAPGICGQKWCTFVRLRTMKSHCDSPNITSICMNNFTVVFKEVYVRMKVFQKHHHLSYWLGVVVQEWRCQPVSCCRIFTCKHTQVWCDHDSPILHPQACQEQSNMLQGKLLLLLHPIFAVAVF